MELLRERHEGMVALERKKSMLLVLLEVSGHAVSECLVVEWTTGRCRLNDISLYTRDTGRKLPVKISTVVLYASSLVLTVNGRAAIPNDIRVILFCRTCIRGEATGNILSRHWQTLLLDPCHRAHCCRYSALRKQDPRRPIWLWRS